MSIDIIIAILLPSFQFSGAHASRVMEITGRAGIDAVTKLERDGFWKVIVL